MASWPCISVIVSSSPLLTSTRRPDSIAALQSWQRPPHEPGLLPRWLHEQGAEVIIAGGMGQRAQQLFAEKGIRVVYGVASDTPESVVAAFLNGTIVSGNNPCDH